MSDEGDNDEQEHQFLGDLELAKSLSLASYALANMQKHIYNSIWNMHSTGPTSHWTN